MTRNLVEVIEYMRSVGVDEFYFLKVPTEEMARTNLMNLNNDEIAAFERACLPRP